MPSRASLARRHCSSRRRPFARRTIGWKSSPLPAPTPDGCSRRAGSSRQHESCTSPSLRPRRCSRHATRTTSSARSTSRTPTTASARSRSNRGNSRVPSATIATCTASRQSCRPTSRRIAMRPNGCSSATASSAARWRCAAPRSRRRNTCAKPSVQRRPWWRSMASRPTGASGWASTVSSSAVSRGAPDACRTPPGYDSAALRVLSELVATDATNSAWQRELASAQVESARLRIDLGELASADPLLEAALATLAREDKAGRGDRNLRLLAAQAHIVRGQLAARRNEETVARRHWIQAREAIANDVPVGANPNFLSAWASAHLLLGEPPSRVPRSTSSWQWATTRRTSRPCSPRRAWLNS